MATCNPNGIAGLHCSTVKFQLKRLRRPECLVFELLALVVIQCRHELVEEGVFGIPAKTANGFRELRLYSRAFRNAVRFRAGQRVLVLNRGHQIARWVLRNTMTAQPH